MTLESILKKLSLLFILFVNTLVAFAVFGIFTKRNVTITIYIAIAIIALFLLKNFFFDKIKVRFVKADLVAIILVVIFCLLTFYFHHDIARGRDNMVHLASAAEITKTGSLSFEDPLAIMYSGFDRINENTFTSQFLPGYTTYLASFYIFDGLKNIPIANTLALFFGLMAIYFLTKRISSSLTGLIALSWFVTFYSVLWFSKRLNSEILFLTLFWCVLWYFFDSLAYKKRVWYFLSFTPLTLLLLTRGEGIIYFFVYLIVTIIILIKTPRRKDDRVLKKRNLITLFIPLFNLALIIIYIVKFNSEYLLSQLGNFQNAFSSFSIIIALLGFIVLTFIAYFSFFASARKKTRAQKEKVLLALIVLGIIIFEGFIFFISKTDQLPWRFFRMQFVLEIFVLYFLFIFGLLILRGLFKNSFTKEHFYLALFCIPSFLFLIEHNIAPDQPWFMRRYLAVFIPFIIIMASVAFFKFQIIVEKKVLFFIGIIVINLTIAFPIIAFIDNQGVAKEIKSFAKPFKENDLILMEPGYDWQRWSYAMHFLYDLNVAPNLNTYPDEEFSKDLKKLVSTYPDFEENNASLLEIKKVHDQKRLESVKKLVDKYDRVYVLAASPFKYPYYNVLNMKVVRELDLNYKTLAPSTQILEHIQSTPNDINLDFVRNSQTNTPPRNIEQVEYSLLLLEVVNKNDLLIKEEVLDEDIVFYRNYLRGVIREYKLKIE